MEWSDDEIGDAEDRRARAEAVDNPHTDETWRKGVAAIMSYTIELAAARGGTMTARQMADITDLLPSYKEMSAVAGHFAAQGARLVELEAERDAARAEVETLKARVAVLREKGTTAESEMLLARAEVERLKVEAAMWRKRVETAAKELEGIGDGEVGRLDIVAKVKRLNERYTLLSGAGQALTEHVQSDDDQRVAGATHAIDAAAGVLTEAGWGPHSIASFRERVLGSVVGPPYGAAVPGGTS